MVVCVCASMSVSVSVSVSVCMSASVSVSVSVSVSMHACARVCVCKHQGRAQVNVDRDRGTILPYVWGVTLQESRWLLVSAATKKKWSQPKKTVFQVCLTGEGGRRGGGRAVKLCICLLC